MRVGDGDKMRLDVSDRMSRRSVSLPGLKTGDGDGDLDAFERREIGLALGDVGERLAVDDRLQGSGEVVGLEIDERIRRDERPHIRWLRRRRKIHRGDAETQEEETEKGRSGERETSCGSPFVFSQRLCVSAVQIHLYAKIRINMKKVFADDILQDKVAFVTGGGTGITGGIARAFAEHGAKLAIVSRKEENLIPMKQLIEENGGECLAVAADVRDFVEVESAIQRTVEHYGRIDIVVNGAAGNFLCAAEQLSANGFGTVVDIDTKGTFNVCRAAFEELKKSGGQIINISATLHYLATPMQIHVSAAKAGVDAITRNLSAEWGRHGIRVNGIAPGPIEDTEGMKRLLA